MAAPGVRLRLMCFPIGIPQHKRIVEGDSWNLVKVVRQNLNPRQLLLLCRDSFYSKTIILVLGEKRNSSKSNLSCDDDYKLLSKYSSKHVNISTLGILRSFEGRGRKSSPALPRTASPFITICKISFAGNRLGLMLPTKTIIQSGKQWTIFSSPSPSPTPSPPAGWRHVLRSQPGDCCHPSSSSPPSIIISSPSPDWAGKYKSHH